MSTPNTTSALQGPGPWSVSYYNPATERRHFLIEDVNEYTADAVVDRFGDNGDPFHQLPEVKKVPAGSKP